jgi:putative hydrolase of the HAD superfamily
MTSASSTVQRDGELLRIVFDFAGVVFRWQPLQLVQQHLPRHAADLDAAHATMAAVFEGFGGDWAQFDRGLVEPDELVRRIVARSGFDAAGVAALVHAVPRALQPDADTVRLLSRLRAAGARLHFLSNMPLPYAAHLDRTHPAVIGHFTSGLYSAREGLIKPEPAFYARAAERFGAPPHRLLLIDDVLVNVEAARRHGWQALHFTDARSCEAALRSQGWWPLARSERA